MNVNVNVNSKTIGIASVVGGVVALLLAPFVTYASIITGFGVALLGGTAVAMGKGDGEQPTTALVAIGLGVFCVIIAIVTLLIGHPLMITGAGG